MIHKYRKRPTIISAMEFSRDSWGDLQDFTDGAAKDLSIPRCISAACKATCRIHTLEGYITATEGDYIIKGVQGEFYPCKPDIFAKNIRV